MEHPLFVAIVGPKSVDDLVVNSNETQQSISSCRRKRFSKVKGLKFA
jgi:hypothetical protein